MSILRQLINEITESAAVGATSATSVAAVPTRFGGVRKRPVTNVEQEEQIDWNKEIEEFRKRAAKNAGKARRRSKFRRNNNDRRLSPASSVFNLRMESQLFEGPENEKFDQADVLSKLKAAEQKSKNEENTAGFALEDEDGNIVKVYVASDQAEDFQNALASALSGVDEDDDNDLENSSLEIAEVLFKLKDRFTIVDVEWPDIEEDEEEQEVADSEEDLDVDIEGDDKEDMEADVQMSEDDLDADIEAGGPEPTSASGDPMTTLQSIIDLLKSQADAQKAEAQAREAAANAEEAKYNAQAAEAKVRQEEEILDMEAYYEEKNKIDKEAKQLAKLAKWKHEIAQEASNSLKGESGQFEMPETSDEEEELLNVFTNKKAEPSNENKKKMQPGDFIKFMLRSIQGN